MFDRLKQVFRRSPASAGDAAASGSQAQGPVSEWAASRGMAFTGGGRGGAMTVQGAVQGRPWRIEIGKPSRDYITGQELRARGEIGVSDEVGAMVINRPLKDALERRAYGMITDTLRTTADPRLPEEMRWLAMYDEIGWEGVAPEFWQRYAVLSGTREHAVAWVNAELVRLLMSWPAAGPGPQVPFMIVLLRGKCYLRMQYVPASTATLDHASAIFTGACESAIGAFQR